MRRWSAKGAQARLRDCWIGGVPPMPAEYRRPRASCPCHVTIWARRGLGLSLLHVFPASGFGGGEDGVADALGFERVAEGGVGWLVLGEVVEEVGDLMDEGMFV